MSLSEAAHQWHWSFHGVPPAGSTVSVCLVPDGDLVNVVPSVSRVLLNEVRPLLDARSGSKQA